MDAADDSPAGALRGVGAGLVERPHLREIAVDFSLAQTLKANPACFPEDAHRAFSQTSNKNTGGHDVLAAVQSTKDLPGRPHIDRLPDHFVAQCDQGVRRENDRFRMPACHRHALAKRIPNCDLTKSQMWINALLDICPNDLESESRFF